MTKADFLPFLASMSQPVDASDVCLLFRIKKATAHRWLIRAAKRGQAVRVGFGKYTRAK